MTRSSTLPFLVVMGARIRALREQHGKRQDDLAATARHVGLRWSRATIATIEAGRRQLSVGEFLLLPYVLGQSRISVDTEAADKPRYPELADLLPKEGWVALTAETDVHAEALHAILRGKVGETLTVLFDTPEHRREQAQFEALRTVMPRYLAVTERIWSKVWPEAKTRRSDRTKIVEDAEQDAEQKAAQKLGVSPLAIAIAAHKLWKHSLTEERDRRVTEQANDAATPRTVQALRGHITRTLLIEIEPLVAGTRGETLPPFPQIRRSPGKAMTSVARC
jgi:transcriptional regulator with XRE-family HTH domain